MNFDRQLNLDRLRTEQFDVLVVGGGITGVGVALDAASRGLRTALVEREDFASGTSSKSSKLIHGGLRYLQQGEVGLVYEALHERQRLRRNAPILVSILPFMIPILTRDGVISKKIARALGSALWMYDLTGGWRIGKLHKRLKAAQANTHLPTINTDRMSSAYLYYDAAADDARLCVTVARTAALYGAVIANRCPVQQILHDENGKVCGARVAPVGGEPFEIQARCVINAAGVWADNVRETDEGVHPNSIRPAKGIHITIPWKMVRNDIAVVIPVKVDKRSLFVVPYISNHDGTYQYTYVGTTDTDFVGGVDESQCSTDDIDYVLTRSTRPSIPTSLATTSLRCGQVCVHLCAIPMARLRRAKRATSRANIRFASLTPEWSRLPVANSPHIARWQSMQLTRRASSLIQSPAVAQSAWHSLALADFANQCSVAKTPALPKDLVPSSHRSTNSLHKTRT